MMDGQLLKDLLAVELVQSKEEGRNGSAVDALAREIHATGNDPHRLLELWNALQEFPLETGFAFDEPNTLEAIQAKRPEALQRSWPIPYDEMVLFDHLYGAWLGRCAGCALGKPVEAVNGVTPGDPFTGKARIKAYLQAIAPGEYPIKDYIPQSSPLAPPPFQPLCPASTREQIAFMEADDDIRYTIVGQVVLQTYGVTFTTDDVARVWLKRLPYMLVCTAEAAAYRNLINRYRCECEWTATTPLDVAWVATYLNPYREWIGAQIRCDSYGYAAAGNPALAAELAWRDARLSHVKNGIYGAMFCAAMIAAAFVLDDPLQIVEAGLNEIPQTSRLAHDIRHTIAICRRHQFHDVEPVLDELNTAFGHYNGVATNNNAALVVAAVLLGGQDFEKGITTAVMGGWDTDCNGATVGSILGAMQGAQRLPEKWIAPLHDTINAQMYDYHPISIRECAGRSLQIIRAFV